MFALFFADFCGADLNGTDMSVFHSKVRMWTTGLCEIALPSFHSKVRMWTTGLCDIAPSIFHSKVRMWTSARIIALSYVRFDALCIIFYRILNFFIDLLSLTS